MLCGLSETKVILPYTDESANVPNPESFLYLKNKEQATGQDPNTYGSGGNANRPHFQSMANVKYLANLVSGLAGFVRVQAHVSPTGSQITLQQALDQTSSSAFVIVELEQGVHVLADTNCLSARRLIWFRPIKSPDYDPVITPYSSATAPSDGNRPVIRITDANAVSRDIGLGNDEDIKSLFSIDLGSSVIFQSLVLESTGVVLDVKNGSYCQLFDTEIVSYVQYGWDAVSSRPGEAGCISVGPGSTALIDADNRFIMDWTGVTSPNPWTPNKNYTCAVVAYDGGQIFGTGTLVYEERGIVSNQPNKYAYPDDGTGTPPPENATSFLAIGNASIKLNNLKVSRCRDVITAAKSSSVVCNRIEMLDFSTSTEYIYAHFIRARDRSRILVEVMGSDNGSGDPNKGIRALGVGPGAADPFLAFYPITISDQSSGQIVKGTIQPPGLGVIAPSNRNLIVAAIRNGSNLIFGSDASLTETAVNVVDSDNESGGSGGAAYFDMTAHLVRLGTFSHLSGTVRQRVLAQRLGGMDVGDFVYAYVRGGSTVVTNDFLAGSPLIPIYIGGTGIGADGSGGTAQFGGTGGADRASVILVGTSTLTTGTLVGQDSNSAIFMHVDDSV